MRVAILISLVACLVVPVWADDSFVPVTLGGNTGYVVPESYAAAHKADFIASQPGYGKIDGFWTPTEPNATVADRTLHELLVRAAREPALLFPDLANSNNPPPPDSPDSFEHQRRELELITRNENAYARQFVGLILDGRRIVFCNYAVVPRSDPAANYLFIQKSFVDDGIVHFLQARFDPEAKTCSGVALIGSWQPKLK
ncbi:MAG: hypothetical protein LV479_09410 [Methylacidiphilales bacterium]|nr:hypothetical protein [Candidatus Methylacidiphilales bacterium]